MIERLIENWLTKTTERAFVVPFCQLLMAEGFKVKWISPHNQNEAGKDVIAEKDGEYHCFQLKDEKINLGFFLKIEPELRELLTHPIVHPSIDMNASYKSYLVTTKEVRDPVPTRIAQKNQVNWGQSKETKLEYWDLGHLLPMFVKSYGAFFPTDPITFQDEYDNFFRLFFSDGTEMLPKKEFCEFYASFLGLYDSKAKSKNELSSAISALLLLTSYVLTPWTIRENHIVQIEAWVCLKSYIYAVVEKYNLPKSYWSSAASIIELQINSLFISLIEELKKRKHLIEGDWFTDAVVYGARASIVLGFISAYFLRKKAAGEEVDEELKQFFTQYIKRYLLLLKMNGEAYLPLFIYTIYLTKMLGLEKDYKGYSYVVLAGLVNSASRSQREGLPNPYYDYEDALEIRQGYKTDAGETFRGSSFFLRSLVELSAREGLKTTLETLWRKITRIQYAEFVPREKWEYFVYRAKKGENQERFPEQSQSWTKLVAEAKDENFDGLPITLVEDKAFAILFGLVFPHRATPVFFRFISKIVDQ